MRAAPHHALSPRYASLSKAVPFATAEEAWFWTMAALMARRDGARIVANRGAVPRNCEPDDVVKCLDRLYRQRRIDLVHARILRLWGERGVQPSPRHLSEARDHAIWTEALSRLEWPLRVKGIVA
ncbi:hypothetical protein [Plastoroseomonas arctica]|uniref:Uncharacterized protein n=1 Tax=Plastoroseomonas arctica TaxID=1509237 RepID=A0AAF1K0C1_9PROT|nr:hypothetical protein [Plastoroseomonas arctica]MBR0654798.1 hypothetical protein [Plastoroseomonas arctica]